MNAIDAKANNQINSLANKKLDAFVTTAYHMLRTLKLIITQNGTLAQQLEFNGTKPTSEFELYVEIDKFDSIPVNRFESVLSRMLTDELLNMISKKNQSEHCRHYYPGVNIVATHVIDNTYYINMICRHA